METPALLFPTPDQNPSPVCRCSVTPTSPIPRLPTTLFLPSPVELRDFEWWLTPSKAVELMQQEDAAVAEKKFGAMGALSPGEDEQLRNMIESTGVFKTFDDLEPTSSRQSTN